MPKIVQYEGQNTIFPNKHHEYIKEDDYTSRPEEGAGYPPEEAHKTRLRLIEQKPLDKEEDKEG